MDGGGDLALVHLCRHLVRFWCGPLGRGCDVELGRRLGDVVEELGECGVGLRVDAGCLEGDAEWFEARRAVCLDVEVRLAARQFAVGDDCHPSPWAGDGGEVGVGSGHAGEHHGNLDGQHWAVEEPVGEGRGAADLVEPALKVGRNRGDSLAGRGLLVDAESREVVEGGKGDGARRERDAGIGEFVAGAELGHDRPEEPGNCVMVAREMSFTKASEKLYLTPSTVHQQVRSLEKELGAGLVHVIGKEVVLTEVGRHFLRCATEIQGMLDEFGRTMAELRERTRGRVRIGASSYFGVLAAAAETLSVESPGIQLEFRTMRPWQAVEELRLGTVDFGFVGAQFLPADLTAEPCAVNDICIVVPRRHELASAAPLSFRELQKFLFVGFQAGGSARLAVDGWLAKHPEFSVRYAAEVVTSLEVKSAAILMNLPAFVVESAVAAELAEGSLVRLRPKDYAASYTLYVLYRPDVAPGSEPAAYLNALRMTRTDPRLQDDH